MQFYTNITILKITRQSKERGTFGKGVEVILIQPDDIKHLPAFAALAYVTDLVIKQ